MNALLVLPILIPFTTAALSLLAWRRMYVQRFLGVAGAFALLGAALVLFGAVWANGILVIQVGSWQAPFGITLVADLFSAIMIVLAGLMGACVAVYSITTIGARREVFGYYLLMHILLMGVCGAFLTGDIFNLYVWFEVMLMASFVLLVLGGERAQIEGAIKYVTLNLVSSAIFLAAVGILYGTVGTLNMADLAVKLRASPETGLITTLAMLFLIAFGIKAAVFPLFFWLPASYHTPPVAVSAIFAGLLTKVGVYALIRVFTLLFVQDIGYTHTLILILAGLTMVTGVLGAAAQNEFRRILSFHIISQIGYMIMGLGLFTPLGLAGSVFYIIHHIIVKTNLFLVSGVTQKLGGSFELKKLGGIYASHPLISLLFLVPAFALAGVPPLSGFFAKFSLAQAGVDTTQYLIVGVALVVGLLTLFSMTKIWAEVFWKPRPAPYTGAQGDDAPKVHTPRITQAEILPIVTLATLTVLIGLFAQPVFDVALRASEQLLDPTAYIQAVTGGQP
jgi:multicomponent Na+:H+ antiporter subunit D